MRWSLTGKITFFSILWISITLWLTGSMLRYLYRDHISSHFDAHVFTHVEELVGAIVVDEKSGVTLAWQPTDQRFHRLGSGWYWEVRKSGVPALKSLSLGDKHLDLASLKAHGNHQVKNIPGPYGLELRAQWLETRHPGQQESLMFVVTAPETPIGEDVKEYYAHILTCFLVAGIGLVLAIILQLRISLRTLKKIEKDIGEIQENKISRLPAVRHSSDLQPLADAVNQLVEHKERLFEKARHQLSDLAHAVKNPLTVIRNEARGLATREGQVILDQTHIIANSIDYNLSMARISGNNAIGLRTQVKPILADLCYVVEHVYKDKNIEIRLHNLDGHLFQGDAQDLEEMLGNLLDNACKWSNHQVDVSACTEDGRLLLEIEDDGPGIPEESLHIAIERGGKLDQSKSGSGQGLAIVKDIAEQYEGELTLARSSSGGLLVRLALPST